MPGGHGSSNANNIGWKQSYGQKGNILGGNMGSSNYRALFIHGFHSTSKSYFFPSTEKTLTDRGYCVFNSDLPNPDQPFLDQWVKSTEESILGVKYFDVILAHSLGGMLALQLLSKCIIEAKRAILIGSSFGPKNNKYMDTFVSTPIIFENIIKNTEKIYSVFSLDDPWTASEYGLLAVKQLGSIGIVYHDMGHFEIEVLPTEVMEILSN
jgi:predicted alpha/beta hydrolase family esterase